VRSSNRPRFSGSTPIRRFTSSGCATTSNPQTEAWPDVGARSPESILTVVDLPAPLGPRKAQMVPLATSKDREFTAVTAPNCLVSWKQEITG
jgi:hypothetical protein